MRVVHVGKYYPPYAGGMENFLKDVLAASERFGVQSAALVHNAAPAWAGEGSARRPPWVVRVPSRGTLLYAPFSPAFPKALQRMLHEFRPQILHFHMPNTSAFWALALPEARKIPWVVHWHADVVASAIDRRLKVAYTFYRPLEQRMLRRALAVIVTSPPYKESSEALKPFRFKCRVVPLGLDPQRLPQPTSSALADAEKIWGPARFRVLSVGRLTYYKGHDVLIRALARVPDARAVIVGTGPQEKFLRRIARIYGVSSRIRFVGRLSDEALHALMARGHVLCLSSKERTEAFGLVLLEAMRYEMPVVAADVPGSGMGWVVCHGKTGLLVRPGDVEELAQALRHLAHDPMAREVMGRHGGKRFRANFHIDRVAQEILRTYEDVLNAGVGAGA